MRNNKKIILRYMMLFLTITSCNSQKKETNIITNKVEDTNNQTSIQETDSMIKEVLKRQIEFGHSVYNDVTDIAYYKYDKNDVDASIDVTSKFLLQNGYKSIPQQEFINKVTSIFGSLKKFNNILFLSKQDRCMKPAEIKYSDSDGFQFNIYFTIDKQLILEQYKLPELIDYQKEYPDIVKYEKSLETKKMDSHGNPIYISRWKDEEDLPKQRRFNQQLLISRNKYLFNDDKSQFIWLTHNDEYFMKSLVTTFGYTEDKKLLKWVIENTKFDKDNPQYFGSLFWAKNCAGKIKLHSNTFKILEELYKPNDNSEMRFLLDHIQNYIEYLGTLDNLKEVGLSENDRVNILANMTYFSEQYKYKSEFYNDGNRMMGRLRFFLDDKQKEILKQNNYYNLPRFKEWWDKAKYDEAYVIECEYGGICGRDNPGPDPNDYK